MDEEEAEEEKEQAKEDLKNYRMIIDRKLNRLQRGIMAKSSGNTHCETQSEWQPVPLIEY